MKPMFSDNVWDYVSEVTVKRTFGKGNTTSALSAV